MTKNHELSITSVAENTERIQAILMGWDPSKELGEHDKKAIDEILAFERALDDALHGRNGPRTVDRFYLYFSELGDRLAQSNYKRE